jgi:hypothetical protein
MDNLAAIFAAIAFLAVFALLVWGIARGWRHLLPDDPALTTAVESCGSCSAKPVCETGALAGLPGSHPAGCPNVERLQRAS